jgi:hypothetical protein
MWKEILVKKKMSTAPLMAAVCLLWSAAAVAKVPASEADKLGKELTCTGAEKAGTASGVPEYSGKWAGVPPGVEWKPHTGQHPVDIYASEKPLFTITAENLSQYASRLSDGQKAMFAKYPKTFRIPVYPGHRDFRYTDEVCAVVKKNAVEAEVIDGGLGIKSNKGGIAFPFPKTGEELLWNNLLPARAYTERVLRDNANVRSDSSITWGRQQNNNLDLFSDPAQRGKPIGRDDIMAYSLAHTLLPERDKGNVSTSSEPLNFNHNKRLTWVYDPGTRRVRQVPEYGFDQPLGGTSGKLTIDSDRLFNGSPERYNWKSLGKREMYIPANSFKIHTKNVKYADLLKPGHANPDLMRYELRRVWVLEGTVKEGYRHMYGKRVMFLDEDSGMAVAGDFYDARGQLWQHAFINYYYDYDILAFQAGTSFYHDLVSGGYLAYNLFQERPVGPILNKGDLKPADFTPEAARNQGT